MMADCKEEFPYYTTAAKPGTPKKHRYDECTIRHACVVHLGLSSTDLMVGAVGGYIAAKQFDGHRLGGAISGVAVTALADAALARDCKIREGTW